MPAPTSRFLRPLPEFQELPFSSKIDLVLQHGQRLLSRRAGNQQFTLFSLHVYYVEVVHDRAGTIQCIRSFTHTGGLDPYFAQLDWGKQLWPGVIDDVDNTGY